MKIKQLIKDLERFDPEQEVGIIVPAFNFVGGTFNIVELRTDDRGYILYREAPHHPDDKKMVGLG